jgi:hypothetical protein
MIASIFNKIISIIWYEQSSPSKEHDKNWTHHGNGFKTRTLSSNSEVLEGSRELRQGAVYSGVEEKFRDPKTHFAPDLDTPLKTSHEEWPVECDEV